DVPVDHTFYTEIEWAVDHGYLSGYSDDTFRPSNTLTRQAAAAVMYRYNGSPAFSPGSPTFNDVPASNPFYKQIEWAADQGLMEGWYIDNFRHPAPQRRGAAMCLLYRDDGSSVFVGPSEPTFSDVY